MALSDDQGHRICMKLPHRLMLMTNVTKHAGRQTDNLSETRGKKADYTKECSGLGVRGVTVSHATPSREGVQHFMPSQSLL